jgi:hypothetical protein
MTTPQKKRIDRDMPLSEQLARVLVRLDEQIFEAAQLHHWAAAGELELARERVLHVRMEAMREQWLEAQ